MHGVSLHANMLKNMYIYFLLRVYKQRHQRLPEFASVHRLSVRLYLLLFSYSLVACISLPVSISTVIHSVIVHLFQTLLYVVIRSSLGLHGTGIIIFY